ncbi:MAG: NAD(P)/FAD-dependent oxidoreductase [Rhizomicrobium sp.]
MPCSVVVGGGAVGTAIAQSLQMAGFTVSLIDPCDTQKPASWGNAGHIAIEQIAPLASLATLKGLPRRLFSAHGGLSLPVSALPQWLPFSLRFLAAARPDRWAAGRAALSALMAQAMPAWERYAAQLGQPGLLRAEGHFIVWSDPAAAARGRRNWLEADCGTAYFREASAEEYTQLRMLTVKPVAGAIRCIGSGQIADLDLFASAARAAFVAAGGVTIRAQAVRLAREAGRVRVELASGRHLDADHVIVAAGVASRPLLEGLGHHVPMIAERGYHVQFSAENWPHGLPPVVFEEDATIVTRFQDVVRASSYLEFNRPMAPADSRKWDRIESVTKEWGLPVAPRLSTWVGSRPTLPDYLPAIGKSRTADNLYYAFGHQHLGLTLAPVTGEVMTDLIRGSVGRVELQPFDLERFA